MIHRAIAKNYKAKGHTAVCCFLQFLRKTVHTSLRMYGSGLEKLQYRCVPEINQMVNRIASFDGHAFDPWNIFYDSACNVMLDLVSYFKDFEKYGASKSAHIFETVLLYATKRATIIVFQIT